MNTLVPRHLRIALPLLQFATFVMLLRSVAFDRWITIAASVLLLGAAYVARRGRTWGVVLSFALGVTFAGVWALGIAPLGFAVLGVLAAGPFVSLLRQFARFDRGATAMLATLAASAGALGALAWKQYAADLFRAFPSLIPSWYPHHGLGLLALVAAALLARRLLPPVEGERGAVATGTTQREDARVRVSTTEVRMSDEEAAILAELESEIEESSQGSELRRSRLRG